MFTSTEIQTFNDLDHILFKYITENIHKVPYMKIRELSNESNISTSTILRFCKKNNCDGFSEFKVKLKIYSNERASTLPQMHSSDGSIPEFFERVLNGNFQHYFNLALDTLIESTNIVFFGIGTSGILAEYGARYFSNLDNFALHINDPFFPLNRFNFDKKTSLIVLSVSGETDMLIHQINKAKLQNCTIISITNTKNCTLAKISDINIPYYVSEQVYAETNITSQLPVIYILETLAKQLSNRKNIKEDM